MKKRVRTHPLDKTIQFLIPPTLVALLTVVIVELFYGVESLAFWIDLFDIIVIIIFAIDLHFRWKEMRKFGPYVKKYWLDIIATVPWHFIFLGIEGLALIQGVRFATRFARAIKATRFTRLIRLARFGTRAPRFLRLRKEIKKGKIRKVQPHEKKMKGVLSFKVILLVTINSIMGTGIWFLTSAGAKHAGPASLVSWGILSLISVYIAMCFGELVSMFPKAGGVYEFAKQAYGRFWSFVIGWTTSIAGSVTIAMLLLGALQYLIPNHGHLYIPIAIGLIVAFNFVAYRGMQTSTYMLVIFALITLVTVTAIIVPGFFNFDPVNFDPFFVFPSMSIILAIFFIAETFFGWESAVFLSAETKNPTKIMPKALVYGTLVIALLAFLLAGTSMGVIPWEQFSQSLAPLRDLGAVHFGATGIVIFTILVFVSVIGAVASWIVTAPRLLMSIAEDKLFFVQFAKIHPKHKSPYVSIAFQVFIVSILVWVGAGAYETLLHMLIPLILLVYSAVLLSVVILRFKRPDLKRPYKVVFGKLGPIITIGFMVFLLVMFIKETHGAMDLLRVSGSLVAFGIPAYFAIELFYNPKYVTVRRDWWAKIRILFDKIPRPKPAYSRMIKYVGPFSTKSIVIDSNSPLGILGKIITKKSKAKVNVLNFSKEEAKHIRKNVKKVYVVKQGSIPAKITKANVFLSYNDLGYVQSVDKFVANVAKKLSKGGKFCFYLTHHFLNVAPNSILVDDRKKLLALFKKHKLKAEYRVTKLPLRRDVFVFGVKK